MAQITCNINKFSVDRLSQIGRGKLSTTYNGKHEDGTRVAVKQLHYTPILEQSTEEKLLSKLKINHRNVVKFLDYQFTDRNHWLVFEHCEQFSLQKYLGMNEVDGFQKQAIMTQCADGLTCLHYNGIIHTRLKPRNILVKKEGGIDVFKLTDYYMTTIFKGEHGVASTYSNETGDPKFFKPPEHFQPDMVYKPSGDVFCLGLIFLALWNYQPSSKLLPEAPGHLKKPVGEVMYKDKQWTSDKLGLIPTQGDICPVKALLNLMLVKDETHRITAEDVLQKLRKIQTDSSEDPTCEDDVDMYVKRMEQQIYSKLMPLLKEYQAIEPTHNLLLKQLDEVEKAFYFGQGPVGFLLKHHSGCVVKQNNLVCYQETSSAAQNIGEDCDTENAETESSGSDSDSDTDLVNTTPYRPLGPGSLLFIGSNMPSDWRIADILINNDNNGTLGCFAEVNINGCIKQFILSVRHIISCSENVNLVDIGSDVGVIYIVNGRIKAQFQTVHGKKKFTFHVTDQKRITLGSCFGILDTHKDMLVDISLLGPLSDFVSSDEIMFSGTKREIDYTVKFKELKNGMIVRKHGAKTGVTTGKIIEKDFLCKTQVVGLNGREKAITGRGFLVAYFDEENEEINGEKSFVSEGDSGSLVYWVSDQGLKAIGLVHARKEDYYGFKHVAVCVHLGEGITALLAREPAIHSIRLFESYINRSLCYKYHEEERPSNHDVNEGRACCYVNNCDATDLSEY